jgi:transposase-like protein
MHDPSASSVPEPVPTATVASARRVRRDASQWRVLIERQQASGLSIAAFCRQHDVVTASFYAWRRRLDESSASPQRTDFVRLEPAQPEVEKESEVIAVRFACGAMLRCPSAQLRELVLLLIGEAGGEATC